MVKKEQVKVKIIKLAGAFIVVASLLLPDHKVLWYFLF